jgi:hypothetical protein
MLDSLAVAVTASTTVCSSHSSCFLAISTANALLDGSMHQRKSLPGLASVMASKVVAEAMTETFMMLCWSCKFVEQKHQSTNLLRGCSKERASGLNFANQDNRAQSYTNATNSLAAHLAAIQSQHRTHALTMHGSWWRTASMQHLGLCSRNIQREHCFFTKGMVGVSHGVCAQRCFDRDSYENMGTCTPRWLQRAEKCILQTAKLNICHDGEVFLSLVE